MRRGLVLVALAGVLAGVLSVSTVAAGAAAPPGLLIGVAKADITPPPFDAAADAAAFALCPAAVFSGPRAFALQEPYLDRNGDGRFEYTDPYCDANHNRRYDGLYLSSAPDHLLRSVHDPIDARAIAFSDGTHTVAIASVVNQGLFENYSHRIRDAVQRQRPGVTDVEISATHNESSPDAIGIYGAPDVDGVAGGRSGIDDYYISFLVDRVASAIIAAYDNLQPAKLRATSFPLPSDLRVRLSNNFPTTQDDGSAAAIDPKVRLLTATTNRGAPIFTMVNLAAHNQEIGHSGSGGLGYMVSGDWPGYMERELERVHGGMGVFLVGANGSEEDPETVPPVSSDAHPECHDGCFAQSQATGEAIAHAALAHLGATEAVRPGPVSLARTEFFVPLENNLFKAAAAAGLFGDRQGYVDGVPVGPGLGTEFRTEVGVVGVGPDIQVLANPGESFPALIMGSPWGIEDASCPDRPNPPVPAWHATARWRFEAGLADDMIGYLLPEWGFASEPGTYVTTCQTDQDDRDARGHQHKLEDESVGPTAGNLVAEQLTALLDAHPDPTLSVQSGRFVLPDGTITRWATGAVGVVLADGRVLAVKGVRAFGTRRVDGTITFVDYDGAPQTAADLSTRGIRTADGHRVFVDLYPTMSLAPLGPAR
jgi:hypothetical protein